MSCTFQKTTNYTKTANPTMDQCCMGIWFLIPTGSGFCLYFKTREPPVPGFLGRNQNQRNHWFQYFKNLKESPGFTKELTVLQVVIWPFPNCLRTMVKYFRCHYFGFSFFFLFKVFMNLMKQPDTHWVFGAVSNTHPTPLRISVCI